MPKITVTPRKLAANRANAKKGGRPRIPLSTPDLGKIGLEGKLPPRPIDIDQVIYWMDIGGTAEEIAGSFRISVDTLDRRLVELIGMGFAEIKKNVCGNAKLRLRRNQFNLTETNATMGIWLGKQWLGQKDEEKSTDSPNHEFIGQLISEIRTLKGKLKDLQSLQNVEESQENEQIIELDGKETECRSSLQ